jgi:hypothetical protein
MIGILSVLTIAVIVYSDRIAALVARMYGYEVCNGRVL